MTTKVEQEKITKLALIAGRGELPVKLAQSAKKQGVEVLVLALNAESYKKFQVDYQAHQFSPVDIMPMINLIKEKEIKYLTFIGKVPKLDFFKNIHKLDSKLMSMVKELTDLNDDSLHFRLLRFLEEEYALEVIDQTKYLRDCFPAEQVFTERQVNENELAEIQYGLKMAKAIAAEDIGQTVVVKNKAVVAVEAIEGTNNCIKRAAKSFGLFGENSITVCKVSKPEQDNRFDVPTVGLETVKSMPPNSILAFEANECFFIDQEAAIKEANKKNIIVCSVTLGI